MCNIYIYIINRGTTVQLTVLCLAARNADNYKSEMNLLFMYGNTAQLADSKQSVATVGCAGQRATVSCITDRALVRPVKANVNSGDR